MEHRLFGKTGAELPVIGQGTWDIPESGARLTEAKRALTRGIELGMTHIDTAEMYGSGRAEEIVGEVIAGLPREGVFVATKVLPSNASYNGTLRACDRSLKRLKLDYVDLYLLHWAGSHPIEETMRAFEDLVDRGKTRFIGVSNLDVGEMRAAQAALSKHRLACNQVLYHLRERTIEHHLIPYCEENGVAVVAYTPFGRGRFPRPASRDGALLETVAKKHGATVRQVILAFLTHTPNVFTIPKAASVPHVVDNAAAGDLRLDTDDIKAIDAAFPVAEDGPLATL